MSVDINGRKVVAAKITRSPTGKRRGRLPGQRFEINLADCPAFCGDNELGLTLEKATTTESPTDRKRIPYMEELEIVVDGSAK